MSKIIQSNIKHFTGTVTIPERFTLPQCNEIDKAFGNPNDSERGERVWKSVLDMQVLPALLTCVEKWDIENFPENLSSNNFPATPRKESHDFIMFVWDEVKKIYYGERILPNE